MAQSMSSESESMIDNASCQPVTEENIASLFDRWNDSLATGNPEKVANNYAEDAVLLATISNTPRLNRIEKKDYFEYFLQSQPSGVIDQRSIFIGCNTAVDAGIYTFTFGATEEQAQARFTFTYAWDGNEWLITSHHSSLLPETQSDS